MALRKKFSDAIDWAALVWVVLTMTRRPRRRHPAPGSTPATLRALEQSMSILIGAATAPRRLPRPTTVGRLYHYAAVPYPPRPRWCGHLIAYGADQLGTDERITVRCTMPDHHFGDHAAPVTSFERAGWTRTPF